MQTLLITGANGFISTYLIPLLLPHYKIIATSRTVNPDGLRHHNLFAEVLDFTDRHSVEALIQKYTPDIVVHAGAMSKPDDCELNKDLAYLTNVTATTNLLTAAKKHKSFFLFLSTDFVFDGEKGFYKEEDPTGNPVNYYGVTKLLAEEAVKEYPFAWSIVRTILVYGKPLEGRHNILTLVKEKLQNGETYSVFHDQVRTPTYVGDLVLALKHIIDSKKEGLYHISGNDVLTPYEMAVAVADFFGADKNLLKKADRESFVQPAFRPLKTGFDISKARRELGYRPIAFSEGLNKTF